MPVDSPGQHVEMEQQPILGRGVRQRQWVKRYRTEVAASLSSVFSTFAAVSANPTQPIDDLPTITDSAIVSTGLSKDAHADLQLFEFRGLRSTDIQD